jgi:GAF domain-containing protein
VQHGTVLTDPARLAAVGRLLPVADAARAALDRLAELAAVVMDAPVGIVNLLTGREQHLVGLAGMAEPYASSRRLPAEIGFCPETVRAGAALYIEDATDDPEFADQPAVRELECVAYAGVPLRDGDGQIIGTVCVTDSRPRRWRQGDRRALEALAESVVSELALHHDIDRRQGLLDAFGHAPAAIAVTRGPDHVLEYRNPAYREIFGEVPLEVPARLGLPELPAELFSLMDRVLATGEVYRGTDAAVALTRPGEQRPRKRFFDFSYSAIARDPGPSRDSDAGLDRRGLLVVAVEVTERVHAHRELQRYARRQQVLAQATAALHRSLDPGAELRALAAAAVPELADVAAVHLLAHPVRPGRLPSLPLVTQRVAIAATAEVPQVSTSAGELRWTAEGPITRAVVAGRTITVPLDAEEPPPWVRDAGLDAVVRAGMHMVAAAPVIVDELVVAIATFGCLPDRPAWTEAELMVLDQLADYAGHALAHGMSFQRTRETALVLQRSLLSEPPAVAGLELCARYQPAGADEVGGDWYDAFLRDDGTLAVVIGDVVGHDMTAAAAMGQLRATLRGLALDRSGGPGAALDRLARINERLAITAFATLVHGHLARRGGRWTLRWASAGHPPPLLLTPDGDVTLLDQVGGFALVPGYARTRTEAEIVLPAGSTLLLYTDGLVDYPHDTATDPLALLRDRAGAAAALPVEKLCDEILRDAPTADDVAVLAVRVEDAAGHG